MKNLGSENTPKREQITHYDTVPGGHLTGVAGDLQRRVVSAIGGVFVQIPQCSTSEGLYHFLHVAAPALRQSMFC